MDCQLFKTTKMVIECLRFRVSPQSREQFIDKDAQIWTSTLASYPGFLGKEVLINSEIAEEIIIVIRWKNHQLWKAIPQDVLEVTEKQFAQQIGEDKYELIECREYQLANSA